MVLPASRNSNITPLLAALLLSLSLFLSSTSQASTDMPGPTVRKPAWAGRFYPSAPGALRDDIHHFADKAEQASKSAGTWPVSRSEELRAVIFPHAGYQYSGIVAARSALELKGRNFSTVIIMGPDHRVGFSNVALSSASAWETPLGIIRLSPKADLLREHASLFRPVELSDRMEHSIEVVLPFLQYALKNFQIIPMVVGPCRVSDISQAIEPLLDESTVIAVSSDLSHYLSGEDARGRDKETIDSILELDDTKIKNDENRACGKYALMVLMDLARRHDWSPRLLLYMNSGDVTGDTARVVGYASIAFYQSHSKCLGRDQVGKLKDNRGGTEKMDSSDRPQFLTQSQGIALTRLARQTIAAAFEGSGKEPPLPAELQAPELRAERGTFVTLTKHGTLRGCIGNILPHGSIIESVKRNALNAAFRDFRFPPLTRDELDEIHIEVSILTLPERLEYSGADDLLAKLKPGIHGVIINKHGASATFLPQVWEQLPDPREFLSRLCMKAGLSANAWKDGDLEVQTYEVQYFDEPEPRSGD